jgi:RNA polymerase sigma factor (sigma-70 family)
MDIEGNSDRSLMERFCEGDHDAFTELYRTRYPAIFRFAFYMTGDRIKAEEVTQDVFVWLIHHPSEFDPERGDLPAFLGGVARKFLLRREHNERRWRRAGRSRSGALSGTPGLYAENRHEARNSLRIHHV